jgi:hypothetical protein
VEGYRRPTIVLAEFRDSDGQVIPYGGRWWDTPSEDLPYSVTAHPERFAPLQEVGRALDEALPPANRAGGAAVPIAVELTAFPGVIVWVGGRDFPFPVCGCDACDEDVEQLAEQMEHLVEAVVEGRWETDGDSFRYWGEWGSHGGWTNPRGRTP